MTEELRSLCDFQGSISSLVVMVLSAKTGEEVLELCATNSGKTPHIGHYSVMCLTVMWATVHVQMYYLTYIFKVKFFPSLSSSFNHLGFMYNKFI